MRKAIPKLNESYFRWDIWQGGQSWFHVFFFFFFNKIKVFKIFIVYDCDETLYTWLIETHSSNLQKAAIYVNVFQVALKTTCSCRRCEHVHRSLPKLDLEFEIAFRQPLFFKLSFSCSSSFFFNCWEWTFFQKRNLNFLQHAVCSGIHL